MILLQPYIIDMFLTNALIQKVQITIRNQVFGDPDKNVTYVPELVDILEAAGCDFDIYAKTPTSVDPIIDLLSLIVSRTFKLISIHLVVSVGINCYDYKLIRSNCFNNVLIQFVFYFCIQ